MFKIFAPFIASICLCATLAHAQDSFHVIDNPVTLSTTGTTDGDTTDFVVNFQTHIQNMSTDSSSNLTITWTYLNNQTVQPTGWRALGICDNIVCRTPYDPAMTGTPQKSAPFNNNRDNNMLLEMNISAPISSPNGMGTYYIEVKNDSLNATQTDTVVFVLTKLPLGIQGITLNDSRVSLYPNPATNSLNVFTNKALKPATLSIYNISGIEIAKHTVNQQQEVTNLNISTLPSGIYLVGILDANGNTVATRKFTKK